jgi:hypothetical protein
MQDDQSDDELFLELMDEFSHLPYSAITPETRVLEKPVSAKRLESCLDCEFNKKLFCSKKNISILTMIKVKDLNCPIGEW